MVDESALEIESGTVLGNQRKHHQRQQNGAEHRVKYRQEWFDARPNRFALNGAGSVQGKASRFAACSGAWGAGKAIEGSFSASIRQKVSSTCLIAGAAD